jgi:hypothetical protein
MIDLQQRSMTGTTLILDDTTTKVDQEQPFDIVEQLLNKDLEYTLEEDVEEGPGKDEQRWKRTCSVWNRSPLSWKKCLLCMKT